MAHTIVKMYNAEIDGVGETTPEAFRQIYQFRGWELVGADVDFAGQTLGRPLGSLDGLDQGELYQVAVAAGFDGAKSTSKANLVKAIQKGAPGGDAPAVVAIVGDTDVIDPGTGEQMTAEQAAARQAEAEADVAPAPSTRKKG